MTSISSDPVLLMVVMGLLAVLPMAVLTLTSFLKISVVLSVLRNALGTQQVPSTAILNGLALILTWFIMQPVGDQMFSRAADSPAFSKKHFDVQNFGGEAKRISEPLRDFLRKHAHERDIELFMQLASVGGQQAGQLQAAPAVVPGEQPGFRVYMAAFITSQLKEAFEVGFLIYLPFLVVDLVIANILIAFGWQMMQPAFVSMPIKLALFVAVDGFQLLVRDLVQSYS